MCLFLALAENASKRGLVKRPTNSKRDSRASLCAHVHTGSEVELYLESEDGKRSRVTLTRRARDPLNSVCVSPPLFIASGCGGGQNDGTADGKGGSLERALTLDPLRLQRLVGASIISMDAKMRSSSLTAWERSTWG